MYNRNINSYIWRYTHITLSRTKSKVKGGKFEIQYSIIYPYLWLHDFHVWVKLYRLNEDCSLYKIPIFICRGASSSSFRLCGMRRLWADAEDVALVWQNEHRHAVKTTESGHKRSSPHCGKENIVARHDLSSKKQHFCTSNPITSIIYQ